MIQNPGSSLDIKFSYSYNLVECYERGAMPLAKPRVGLHAWYVEVMRMWLLTHHRGRRVELQPRAPLSPAKWHEFCECVDDYVRSCRAQLTTEADTENRSSFLCATVGEVRECLNRCLLADGVEEKKISTKALEAVEALFGEIELYSTSEDRTTDQDPSAS